MTDPVRGGDARAAARRERLVAAAEAGLLGAALVAVFMGIAAAVQGLSPLAPLRPMGAAFRGADALPGGAGNLAYGLLLHAAGGMLLAVPLAFLLRRDESTGAAMVMGTSYALVGMALAVTFVLPEVDPAMVREMSALGGSWVIAWALFGAALGTIPALRRRSRRPLPLAPARAGAGTGRPAPHGGEPGPARA